jgi:hypothetical protein
MANRQATATLEPVNANLAVLGGSQAAFTHNYGQPFAQYLYDYTAPHGDRVLLTLGTLHNLVTGSIRVRMIILQPADNKMWDTTTAQTLYEAFFPPDARFAHEGASATGASGIGIYRFYTSALLANTFPAYAFVDTAGKRLPPGTFEVVCNNKILPGEGDVNGCSLIVGEWPRT